MGKNCVRDGHVTSRNKVLSPEVDERELGKRLVADYFDNVLTTFIFNNRADAWITEVDSFFTITDIINSYVCSLVEDEN